MLARPAALAKYGAMTDKKRPVAVPEPPKPEDRKPAAGKDKTPETGGPAGPEPTRYGDWERGGRCVDF
jgi:hypothetical protein